MEAVQPFQVERENNVRVTDWGGVIRQFPQPRLEVRNHLFGLGEAHKYLHDLAPYCPRVSSPCACSVPWIKLFQAEAGDGPLPGIHHQNRSLPFLSCLQGRLGFPLINEDSSCTRGLGLLCWDLSFLGHIFTASLRAPNPGCLLPFTHSLK